MIEIQWVVEFYFILEMTFQLWKHYFGTNIENLPVETNLRKRKWFFDSPYSPHRNKISYHLNYLNLACSKYSKVYDNFISVGDFNIPMSDKFMKDLCFLDNLESLIAKPTCYKNHENPTSIDLILTNRPGYFQQSNVFETGISNFPLLIATQLKMCSQKKATKNYSISQLQKI